MAIDQDILLDDTNDVQFSGGDFITGESNEQHIGHILCAAPGDYKQYPIIGCDLKKALNGNVGDTLLRNIRIQLSMDGFNVNYLNITGSEMKINATK